MNTQQRDLIERAAAAAGYDVEFYSHRILFWRSQGFVRKNEFIPSEESHWDPVGNDTDLLNLCADVARRHGNDVYMASLAAEFEPDGDLRIAMLRACAGVI